MNVSKFKSDLKKTSLLIIGDKENVNTISQIFKISVKNIYLAQDGEIAYSLFKKNSPDIIITNFNIPKLNGKNLIKKIRKDNKTIPIIVITSYEDNLTKDELKLVSGVLEKPINFIKFVTLLDTCIQELNK